VITPPGIMARARACGRTHLVLLAGMTAAVCALAARPAGAAANGVQGSRATAVTAAFLYNFAKFTEWPREALPDGAPLVLCVMQDAPLAAALREETSGRTVEGHPLVVRQTDGKGPLRSCHILYAANLDAARAAALLQNVQPAPVLVVSDFEDFSRLGGTAHLFVEDDRMRFAINVDAAARAGLRISSRLLSLAVIVKDGPNASGT
jgi:hypothetical protein